MCLLEYYRQYRLLNKVVCILTEHATVCCEVNECLLCRYYSNIFCQVCLLNTWNTVVDCISRCKARNFRSYTNRTYALLHKPYICTPTQTVRMRSYTNRKYVLLHKTYVCAPTQTVRIRSYTNRTYALLHKLYVCASTQNVRMRSYTKHNDALLHTLYVCAPYDSDDKQRSLCSIFNNCTPIFPNHKSWGCLLNVLMCESFSWISLNGWSFYCLFCNRGWMFIEHLNKFQKLHFNP